MDKNYIPQTLNGSNRRTEARGEGAPWRLRSVALPRTRSDTATSSQTHERRHQCHQLRRSAPRDIIKTSRRDLPPLSPHGSLTRRSGPPNKRSGGLGGQVAGFDRHYPISGTDSAGRPRGFLRAWVVFFFPLVLRRRQMLSPLSTSRPINLSGSPLSLSPRRVSRGTRPDGEHGDVGRDETDPTVLRR